jgi:hypothetical protein
MVPTFIWGLVRSYVSFAIFLLLKMIITFDGLSPQWELNP